MTIEWAQLYESMQADLESCKKKQPDLLKQIERCFQICVNYWTKLAKNMEGHEFATVAEEIRFYKQIKPLFISEIRYCEMQNHAVIFQPKSQDTEELMKFWMREQLRIEKFVREHQYFFDYCRSGSRDHDEEWFTKPVGNNENIRVPQHDLLAGTVLAIDRYSAYLKKQISQCTA